MYHVLLRATVMYKLLMNTDGLIITFVFKHYINDEYKFVNEQFDAEVKVSFKLLKYTNVDVFILYMFERINFE